MYEHNIITIFYLKSFSCYISPTLVPSSESANWKARYVGVWLGGYKNGNFLIFWYNNVFNLTYSQRFQLFFSLLVLHTNSAANKNDEEEDNSCSGSSNYDWYYIIPLKYKFNISVSIFISVILTYDFNRAIVNTLAWNIKSISIEISQAKLASA